jgi:hypothetical protein
MLPQVLIFVVDLLLSIRTKRGLTPRAPEVLSFFDCLKKSARIRSRRSGDLERPATRASLHSRSLVCVIIVRIPASVDLHHRTFDDDAS